MFVSTIKKTLKSYFFAIVGAEYILRWLPIGTHEWEKFVKPEDLIKINKKYNLPEISEKSISNTLLNKLSNIKFGRELTELNWLKKISK